MTSGRLYRPQFAYPPAPAGFKDEMFAFYFDSIGVPALGQGIPVGATIANVPLQLDRDAPFIWRASSVLSNQAGLGVQFQGPSGSLLSNGFVPVLQSFFPSGALGPGFGLVTHEPEIECPVSGVVLLTLANLSAAPIVDPTTKVLLMGVKRWRVKR
jgi:hypothetical protein